ncbi:MAG TPA: bifunctional UDP-sugar hydrolase/5'-nucleotidase [Pyrinomonadaceae bacterium]|nr:bifunctional UDP-sugar hydrolase/5'-nucleotidase [Pyrinomonadaceae bacterium]
MADEVSTKQPDKPATTTPDTESSAPPQEAVALPKRLFTWLDHKLGTLGLVWLGQVLILILALAVIVFVYRISSTSLANDSSPSTELIIVQLNDIYRLDAVRAGKRGGLARVVTLLRQLKAQNPQVPVIVVHAGDFLSPSLESNVFHGMQMIDAMNFINDVAPLYVVPGNHEFDYEDKDKEHLTAAIAKSRFPWIAANLEWSNTSLLPALRDRLSPRKLETIGEVKLGIFGLTLDGEKNGGKDKSYAPISGEYEVIAGEQIQKLENEGAELIVGLTHLNMGDDRQLARLKQQHPRFLWIAGGHEHSLDREGASPGGALVTKGDSNARTVWKITVTRNGENLNVSEESIVIDESVLPDPAFAKDIENFYEMKLRNERPYLDTVISTQPARCYDGTEEAVRDRESDWGNFLTDTMLTTYKGITADVAVLNGGGIRIDDIICGQITFEDLERSLAYPTPIVFVKLKGAHLRQYILDHSVGSKRGDGRFLQVSGVSFRREQSVDGTNVIKDLQIQSRQRLAPFDDNKTYIVAVNKWIFECEDGYNFRQFVSDYVPPGPDLRTLTYAALSAQTKNKPQAAGRIIDLPAYVKSLSMATPAWQTLDVNDRACPGR